MSPEIKRGPMSPTEAMELQMQQIPDEVFIAFNALIAQNLSYGRSIVGQKEVVDRLKEQGIDINEMYRRHWLDVEDSYRALGWKVMYDKPGYNEDYDAYFEFRAPKAGLVQEYY